MTSDNNDTVSRYKRLAEIIYAEHPESKEQLNTGAALAIEGIRQSLTAEIPAKDLEGILSMIAAIMADMLSTPVGSISDKVNLIFDTYSLAAGAVAGAVDLGDTTPARDMLTLVREAHERANERTEGTGTDDGTGMFL
jgi:hypothetical protein